AEDGIRDFHVTGVQTCALPISSRGAREISIEITLAPRDARMTAFTPPHPRSTTVFPRTSPNKWNAYSRGKTVSSRRSHVRIFHSDRKSVVEGKSEHLGRERRDT